MLIFYQLFPHCRRQSLVAVVTVGVSSLSLFHCCRQRRPFLWLRHSASETRRRRRLVVVVFVVFDGVTEFSEKLSLYKVYHACNHHGSATASVEWSYYDIGFVAVIFRLAFTPIKTNISFCS